MDGCVWMDGCEWMDARKQIIYHIVNSLINRYHPRHHHHHDPTAVGERGVGKSVVLNQAVYYARKKGWLCIFVPQGWEQVQGRENEWIHIYMMGA